MASSSRRSFAFDRQLISHLIEECKWTHAEMFQYLESQFGPAYGLSERTLRRFCHENSITRRSGLCDDEVVSVVRRSIDEVGSYFGSRTLKGHIECKYVQGVSEKRILAAMKQIDPESHAERTWGTHRRFNPNRYFAPYFGYNLHIDQNEKLVDYGIVFVAAIDGYSSFVFRPAVMPRKNNSTIYRDLFKSVVADFGLFRRVHADYGGEFALTIFMQKLMWYNFDPEIDVQSVYRQSKSTSNNRIERVWVEINQRVGYPIKYALVELEAFGLVDRDTPHHLYSISQVGMWIARHGLDQAVNAWNHHCVRGRGVPISLMYSNCGTVEVDPRLIVDEHSAVQLYRECTGGQLKEECDVGYDLLKENVELQFRRNDTYEENVASSIGSAEEIFGTLVNRNNRPFQSAVLLHIQLSEHMSQMIHTEPSFNN